MWGLTDADLSGAILIGADLTDATLTDVDDETLENGRGSDDASLASVVESIVTGTTLVLAFSLLAVGWSGFWIGFAAVYPAATRLARWYENETRATGSVSDGSARSSSNPKPNFNPSSDSDSSRDERATVRERYAAGELTDAAFERRVEQLLEPESASDAEGVSRASETDPADPSHETEPTDWTRETETELERETG